MTNQHEIQVVKRALTTKTLKVSRKISKPEYAVPTNYINNSLKT